MKVTHVTVMIDFEFHDVDIDTAEEAAELLNHIIEENPDFIGELTADNIADMCTIRSTLPPEAGE